MFKVLVTLVGGIVLGVAIVHFASGPIDWASVGEQTGEVVADTTTATVVRAALALQKDFDLFGDVGISARAGVVTLTGNVLTKDQRELAGLISRGVQGVNEVINNLEVTGDGPGDSESEIRR